MEIECIINKLRDNKLINIEKIYEGYIIHFENELSLFVEGSYGNPVSMELKKRKIEYENV